MDAGDGAQMKKGDGAPETNTEMQDSGASEELPAASIAVATMTHISCDVPFSGDIQVDDQFFYFVSPGFSPSSKSFGNIYRLPRAGGTAEILVPNLSGPIQGQLRLAAGKLAYINDDQIHLIDLATSSDTTPIGDDPKNSAASPGLVQDIAVADDGLYWLVSNGDNPAGGPETWIERRLWTATASETLAPGVKPLADQTFAGGGQVFGRTSDVNEGSQLWSWTGGVPRAMPLVAQVARLANRPNQLPVDDQFVYFMPPSADKLQRIPRAGGAIQTLATFEGAAVADAVLYGQYALWADSVGSVHWFAIDTMGGAPIEVVGLACDILFSSGQTLFCTAATGHNLFEVSISGL